MNVKSYFILIFICSIITSNGLAQDRQVRPTNEIIEVRSYNAASLIRYLQNNSIGSIKYLIDSSYYISISDPAKYFMGLSKSISKLGRDINISYGLILYEDDIEIHRMIFFNNEKERLYQIDLHFRLSGPETLICNIAVKNRKELKREERKLRHLSKAAGDKPPV